MPCGRQCISKRDVEVDGESTKWEVNSNTSERDAVFCEAGKIDRFQTSALKLMLGNLKPVLLTLVQPGGS